MTLMSEPQRKIRVLQLIESFDVGGAERVVTLLATHLNPQRFEVIPCAIRAGGPLTQTFEKHGMPYKVLGIQRHSILTGPVFCLDLARLLATLTRLLRKHAIDIVHAHLTEDTLLGLLAARLAGVPYVCATVHSIVFASPRHVWDVRQWCLQRAMTTLFARVNRVITVSAQVAQVVQQKLGLPHKHVVTIPNGVEPGLPSCAKDRAALRRQLALEGERPVVIAVGRLAPEKGHKYLLAALAQLPQTHRPQALIVGDGPERESLQGLALELGLTADVRFLGNRNDVPTLLTAADVFILPSLWEGLSLALLEAMAAGLPVIATAVGGNPEVVDGGRAGMLVPIANVEALTAALTSLLQDPVQRAALGRNARERFDYYYSVETFVNAHERLYQKLFTPEEQKLWG